MKIDNSGILLASARTFMKTDEGREVFRAWIDQQGHEIPGDRVTISQKPRSCMPDIETCIDEIETDYCADYKTTLEALLVEILSGREVRIIDASVFQKDQAPTDEAPDRVQTENRPQREGEGWGVEYSNQSSHLEKEDVSFVAAGIINTADGKQIDFSLRLDMNREFISYRSLNFRAGDAILMDPLILNFDGRASELTDTKFFFDLDSDGVEEDLPMIRPGSGFLALDLNKDGIINNGNELFGPRTGNGFAELSRYDQDANNWIDESDSVYDQLTIWRTNSQGDASLTSLKDKGIEAIYLGNLSSRFDLKGSHNRLVGQIARTGIFLYENDIPGTIQQLDLTI